MKKAPLLAALVLTVPLLTGCEDPCLGMEEKADPAAQELMEKGYEVSKDMGDDVECELQPNGKWEEDV